MRKTLTSTVVALAGLALASAANAQATRTWVSGVGDDANPCSRTAPCKTFAGAISKTASGGEISVLDPGGYGAVTITKAITINGTGTLASILVAGTSGIIVNATANDEVIIRNISIHGANTGLNGIRYLAGRQLTVENVTIEGFNGAPGRAISAELAAAGVLHVKDTNITNCTAGIRMNTTAVAPNTGVLIADNLRIERMTNDGIELASGPLSAMITNSLLSANGLSGVHLSGAAGQVNIDSSTLQLNVVAGLKLDLAGSNGRISRNTFLNNSNGLQILAGTVRSSADNIFAGNSIDGAPNGAALLKQ